jgi:YrbI family 3-deoxy-D-manno-octulosonate 8-phosphate phosphatase
MYYDCQGNELKKYNTSDSAGLLFLKQIGIPCAVITGERNRAIEARCAKLGLADLHMGVKDKLTVANGICRNLGIPLSQVAYIGDDIFDMPLLKAAGLSACPANAPEYVKQIVMWRGAVKGGEGAFREFVERYLKEAGLFESTLASILNSIPN